MGEIRTYTEAEMMSPEAIPPPGWRTPADLPAVISSLSEPHSWTPVLSVSVFRDHPDQPGDIQALTLVRGASTTHSDVLSTLTGTFPSELAPLIAKRQTGYVVGEYPQVAIGAHGPNPRETGVIATYAPRLEGVPDTTDLLSFLTHDIMGRKLGRPDLISMQSDDELGTVSLARIALGVSYVGEDRHRQARYERLVILGLAFMLHPHQSHMFDADVHDRMSAIPPDQRRYNEIGWMHNVQLFPEAVRTKNVIELAPYMPENQAVTVCVQGQCLAMTSELIKGPDLMAHLGRMSIEDVDYGGQIIGDPYDSRGRKTQNRKLIPSTRHDWL